MKYNIWTDGSSINQKYGGWAYLIINGPNSDIQNSGRKMDCTNNQAELLAVYKALQDHNIVWDKDTEIVIFTDSLYVINMLVKNWRPKVNREIIYGIKDLLSGRKVRFYKTEAHTDDVNNILVDRLAYAEADRLHRDYTDNEAKFTVTLELEEILNGNGLIYVARFENYHDVVGQGADPYSAILMLAERAREKDFNIQP